MQSVYPGVFRLQSSFGSNTYVVRAGSSTAVIDPGLALNAGRIVEELREAGLLGSVTHILLTHHDFDHVGAAPRLQDETGAVVRIGAADAEVLAGKRTAGTWPRQLMARVPARRLNGPIRGIAGAEEVFPGVTSVPTPGHTDGHVAFLAGEVLFAGDAIRAKSTRSPGGAEIIQFRLFPQALTNDRAEAVRSAEILRGLDARWLCPGHGRVREMAA
ncbi:MBL fold metallo-hydrolase [Sinomonas sp. P10A9]|uniref:MBL fold metallo-hydrolase n=1 Tax=Sinomonas puerhi TaxID=3238584 RepID=A0AB39L2C9_9MICC